MCFSQHLVGQYLVVELDGVPEKRLLAELGLHPQAAGLPKTPSERRVAHQHVQLGRQVLQVARLAEDAVDAVGNRIGVPSTLEPIRGLAAAIASTSTLPIASVRDGCTTMAQDPMWSGRLGVMYRLVVEDLRMSSDGVVQLPRVREPAQDLELPGGYLGAICLNAVIRTSMPFSLKGKPAKKTSLFSSISLN